MFTAITAHQANIVHLLCELRHLVHVNLFWDPLWDPLRDLLTTPISAEHLRRLHDAAQRIVEMTEQLSRLKGE